MNLETEIPAQTDSDSVFYSNVLKVAKDFQNRSEFDSALVYLQNSLLRDKSQSNTYYRGLIYLKLGYILGNLHKNDNALEYYKKALSIGLFLKNNELIGKGFLGVGGIYQIDAQKDSALKYYSKCLDYLWQESDSINIQGLYSNIGLILASSGRSDSAQIYLENALSERFKLDDKEGIIGSLNNLGNFYFRRGNYAKAKDFYLKSLKFATNEGITSQIANAYKGLAKTFNKFDKHEESILYFLKYDSIATQYLHEDYGDKILELETKYKTAEIERDNALKQAEIEENKRELYLLNGFIGLLLLTIFLTYYFLNQRRKRLKAASNKQIQDLLQEQEIKTTYALLQGQDKERKRVAEELHDSLGSVLVTLNMYADSLSDKKPEEISELAKKISKTANLANEETRRISHNLYSGMLQHFGLEAAIQQLSEAVIESKQIPYDVEVNLESPLSTEVSLEVYRVIQELTNNSLKHSDCTRIRLEINYLKESLTIIFEDNGKGFNKDEIDHGLGLHTIASRVSKLDGDLTIDSSPGKGSTFIIEISHL